MKLEESFMSSIYADPHLKPPLDEQFYSLSQEELFFFKSQTGIQDDEELKQHIIRVQTKAYEIYGYPCIRRFAFTKLKISRLPAYSQVLELIDQRENAILLDIGCCFGNDLRKAVVDGWPIENAIASDLRQGFWDYGHELFKSTPQTFPATFIAGDAFDPAMISPREPFYEAPETPRPALNNLTSLTPLQGHVSAIHASSFFHLFDEEQQLQLGRQLATLLSPAPGSILFGMHGGLPEKGFRPSRLGNGRRMFCHDPQTWIELWDGEIFKKGTVRVEARLHNAELLGAERRSGDTEIFHTMSWSVTRL